MQSDILKKTIKVDISEFNRKEKKIIIVDFPKYSSLLFRNFKHYLIKKFRLTNSSYTDGLNFGIRFFISKYEKFCEEELKKNVNIICQLWLFEEWLNLINILSREINNKQNFDEKCRMEILTCFLILSGKLFSGKNLNSLINEKFDENQERERYKGVIFDILNEKIKFFSKCIKDTLSKGEVYDF